MTCAKCKGKVRIVGRTTHWYECENCGPVNPEGVLANPENWAVLRKETE